MGYVGVGLYIANRRYEVINLKLMEILTTLKLKNESETRAFGCKLAKSLKKGDVLALVGELGTGKTALTKYIAEGLGITETINSPTFTIVKEYHSGTLPLYHFDVYRVSDPDELFEIGIDEYFYGDGVCVVEWANLIESELPENAKYIYIEYSENEGERIYKCTF